MLDKSTRPTAAKMFVLKMIRVIKKNIVIFHSSHFSYPHPKTICCISTNCGINITLNKSSNSPRRAIKLTGTPYVCPGKEFIKQWFQNLFQYGDQTIHKVQQDYRRLHLGTYVALVKENQQPYIFYFPCSIQG